MLRPLSKTRKGDELLKRDQGELDLKSMSSEVATLHETEPGICKKEKRQTAGLGP